MKKIFVSLFLMASSQAFAVTTADLTGVWGMCQAMQPGDSFKVEVTFTATTFGYLQNMYTQDNCQGAAQTVANFTLNYVIGKSISGETNTNEIDYNPAQGAQSAYGSVKIADGLLYLSEPVENKNERETHIDEEGGLPKIR